ncbi:hypothetical protein [Microcoleus sp. MON2_D5]|uniref:hypothetical protein n=1 Tax=Microcoleus sp. MON2_D5 TaxID=2818833 RepID=UPI002FD02AE9
MTHPRRKMADMQLTGTQLEIGYTLAVLTFRGCLWETDKIYHPLGDGKFVYTLTNVTAPTAILPTHI